MKWSSVTGSVVVGSLAGLGIGYSLLSRSRRKALSKRSRRYLGRQKSLMSKMARKVLH